MEALGFASMILDGCLKCLGSDSSCNDNNSNNLTKSRRLLNELIGLYEG